MASGEACGEYSLAATRRCATALLNLAGCAIVIPMRTFLISLVAGALVWTSILLIAIAYQPSHAGSVIANIEIGLALVVTVIACFLLRLR